MKKLVIAEKPSVAMSIAKVLGVKNRKDGYIEGNAYIISWCVGHLVGLSNAETYDENYKKWNFDDLPIVPSEFKFTVLDNTKKQFNVLKKLITDKDVDELICATDSGREGELIFRLVYEKIGSNKPFKRLWISSMEESSIKDGFDNLKDGREFDNLYKSALLRAKADWIVGINATRLFSLCYTETLNVGRVQTPTLRLITDRCSEINNFKSEKFYTVNALLDGFSASSEKISDKTEAESLSAKLENKSLVVTDVKSEKKTSKTPLPYDLTTLQREANRLLSFTSKQTLDYAQSLYEKKLITYPRTDSRYLNESMADTLNKVAGFSVDAKKLDKILNDKKVADHHAIIPTLSATDSAITELPSSERKIFELVKMRLLTSVSDDYIEESTVISLECDGDLFKAKENIILQNGFKDLENQYKSTYLNDKKDDKVAEILPKLNSGDVLTIKSVEIKDGKTTPPKYFTEDTLLSAMERAGNDNLDKDLDTEKKGIGTPATRAAIIEKLIKSGFVVRDKKNLKTTDKGYKLIDVVSDELKSPKLTAEWENKLTEIAIGKENDSFLADVTDMIKNLVIKNKPIYLENKDKNLKESLGKCLKCSADVYEGKKNYYCSNKNCDFCIFKNDKFLEQKKIKLTKKEVKELLNDGKTYIKDIYSEKTGKKFNADVSIFVNGKYVNYKFDFKK